jgi:hypothetical protein
VVVVAVMATAVGLMVAVLVYLKTLKKMPMNLVFVGSMQI